MPSDDIKDSIEKTANPDFDSDLYYGMFGKCVPRDPRMTVSAHDLACHVYAPPLPAKCSGKATIIKIIAKHLEQAN